MNRCVDCGDKTPNDPRCRTCQDAVNNADVLPCLVCGKRLEHVMGRGSADAEQDMQLHGYIVSQPNDATTFRTRGHYGSDHFDALWDDAEWEIAICSDCLSPRLDRTRVLVRGKRKAVSFAEFNAGSPAAALTARETAPRPSSEGETP